MNDNDVWYLGLFALAFLYLDARTPVRRREAPRADPESADPAPARPAPPACPRRAEHAVRARLDGALWCYACDEAFYPQHAVWNPGRSAVAA